ncbi:hypothetical protein IAQ61_010626 [Plenodomus lingam]|uniref:uncharacterized protein n=1 Tax=Leptosphaeria maculans TaxID=5022 RepID=UPI0033349F95|nr:hypothetical protein IAQ61_010626 [Plenodomus lingam]
MSLTANLFLCVAEAQWYPSRVSFLAQGLHDYGCQLENSSGSMKQRTISFPHQRVCVLHFTLHAHHRGAKWRFTASPSTHAELQTNLKTGAYVCADES